MLLSYALASGFLPRARPVWRAKPQGLSSETARQLDDVHSTFISAAKHRSSLDLGPFAQFLHAQLSLLRRENGYKELVAQLHDRLHAQKHELDQLRSEVAVTKEREAKFKTYHQMAMDTVAQHEQVMQTQLRSGLAERADLLQQLNAAQLENQVHAMLCSRAQSSSSACRAVRCRADVHACNAASPVHTMAFRRIARMPALLRLFLRA